MPEGKPGTVEGVAEAAALAADGRARSGATYELGGPEVRSMREIMEFVLRTIERERIHDACLHARDELGFNMLSGIVATDYLGWGEQEVAGYVGTVAGRDIHEPGSQGLARVPDPKPRRFSVSYHLLRVDDEPTRVRVQVWLDDGEPVPTVVPIWPGADWFEREAWDMMGIPFEGHPNLEPLIVGDVRDGDAVRQLADRADVFVISLRPGLAEERGLDADGRLTQIARGLRRASSSASSGRPLQRIAIVDEAPQSQFLYPEFRLFQRLFERAGIAAVIADPADRALPPAAAST